MRRSALVETLVFLSVAVFLNVLFGDGTRFIDVNPHPFWIIVLLVIVQYGQREAVFAALLATAFLLVGNLPEQSLTETMYDYYFRIFLQPLLWIVSALLLGSLRSRQLRERETLFERLWKSEEAAHILGANYLALKKAKERLELRLAEEKRSVLTVYRMATTLAETEIPLAEQVGRLVETALHPRKFSFFLCEDSALTLEKSFGWKSGDAYARRFAKKSSLAREFAKNKRTLSIADEEQAAILGREGIIAGPLFDRKTGVLFGLLKIEEMDFIDLGANTLETFKFVCDWIALAKGSERGKKEKINGVKHRILIKESEKPVFLADPSLAAPSARIDIRDTA